LNDDQWYAGTTHYTGDTHFADIHLPSTEKAEARGKLWEYYSRKYGVMDWGYANRQEPDPYAELKKAHAEGKVIQLKPLDRPWEDLEDPDFAAPISCYRIKPEPETFQAHGKAWTRHTPGDPMPCDGERMVYVLTPKTGESEEPYKASMYSWTAKDYYWWGEIIGWRYADEPSVTSPEWTPQVGDVVRLKSGGPLMTVARLAEADPSAVLCEWFDRSNRYDAGHITIACLEPATKEDAR
jgi:uncharacterized protein YodC (DUF2158 family)